MIFPCSEIMKSFFAIVVVSWIGVYSLLNEELFVNLVFDATFFALKRYGDT